MLKVGFYQYRPLFGKVKKNREKALQKLKTVDCDLMVLPELAFTGYHFKDKSELFQYSENPVDSKTVWELGELCKNKDMYVVTGFAEQQDDHVYNSALLIGPDGLIHTYRKIQLFNREKEMFTPGDVPLQVHEIKGAKIGIMVCFDWIFPEIARTLALKGADIICHPSNLVLSYCQQAMLTRCLENNVFAITTNRFGADKRPHGTLKFTGKSQVAAPKGELIHRAKSQVEEIFITEINPREARQKNMTETNHIFKDRRTQFYGENC